MNLHEFIEKIISFGQSNPIIAFIFVLVFLFFIYRKRKLTLSIILFILLLVSLYYVIMDTASSAKTEKKRLIEQSEKTSTVDKQ